MAGEVKYGGLPFQEAIDFFRNKVNLPTARWDDLKREQHDASFTVAGALKADLLMDIRKAVDAAIVEGISLAEFRDRFGATLRKYGWSPYGGEAWRAELIMMTNIRTAYQAGRYRQMTDAEMLKSRPYWQYRHGHSRMPRPMHLAWNNLVLPANHPWWQTHYPPNGWGCKCRVFALSERDLKRQGLTGPDEPPNDGTVEVVDKNGKSWVVPKGIDPGWDYTPGASLADRARKIVEDRSGALPPPLANHVQKEITLSRLIATASNIKEAQDWAVAHRLADVVDYTGIHVDIANAWNQAIFDVLQMAPALRERLKFIGTAQARNKVKYNATIAEGVRLLMAKTGCSREQAEGLVRKYIKPERVPSGTLAVSTNHPLVSGISVNSTWGRDPEKILAALKRDAENGFYPAGCHSLRYVVEHELGHQLDALLQIRSDNQVEQAYNQWRARDLAGRELSRYARTSIAEFIAEAWGEFRTSPNPRPLARLVGELIASRSQGVRP